MTAAMRMELFRFVCAAAAAAVAALVLSVCCGCRAQNSYREGTNLMLGMYVPTSEGLVGLNVLDYLNGCEVHSATNIRFSVTRMHAATNSYFGVVTTTETTTTRIGTEGGAR